MPKGPQGQRRPCDVVSNAVKVMRIATGEAVEEYKDDKKHPVAGVLNAKGSKGRAAKPDKE